VVDELGPHLLASLDALQRRVGAEMADRAEASGLVLRGSHARILDLVDPEGSRPARLAAGGWISKQAIAKRIQELQERDLVEVEPDPTDGRATVVRRTPEGDRVRDAARLEVAGLERELRDQVGAARYAVFRAVLDELGWSHDPAAAPAHARRHPTTG
jgi:DNA-binding MarR family transcriptional regulator